MIDGSIREFVRRRANERCEYCRLPAIAGEATFHIEHIVARQHAPQQADDPENLALACHRCNLHKGTNLSSIDPQSGELVPLFDPRRDHWHQHFELQGARIVGRSATGRATVQLLQFNARLRVELRGVLIAEGKFDV